MAFPTINSATDAVKVPPPPPSVAEQGDSLMAEVVVRTLASDLKSLGVTGGVGAVGENFTVSLDDSEAPAPRHINFRAWGMWTIVAISGLIVLFLLGYYFIPALLGVFRKGVLGV